MENTERTAYELLFVLGGHLTENEMQPIQTRIEGFLKDVGADITIQQSIGKAKLAYPIGQHRYGHYIVMRFTAEPSEIQVVNEKLRLDTDIVRYIIVREDEVKEEVTSFAQATDVQARSKVPMPAVKRDPVPAASVKKSSLTPEDLDKKLDEILTEEVK